MLSAETDRSEEISSSDIIANKLKTKHEHQRLQPSKIYEIDKAIAIDGCLNEAEGVKQLLLAIIKAGHDYYSIVQACYTQDDTESRTTVITRSVDNARAELISVAEDNQPVVIGDEHFVVLDTDNTLYIADMKSPRGTHMFTAKNEFETVDESIGGIRFWSAKSGEVRDAIETIDLLFPIS